MGSPKFKATFSNRHHNKCEVDVTRATWRLTLWPCRCHAVRHEVSGVTSSGKVPRSIRVASDNIDPDVLISFRTLTQCARKFNIDTPVAILSQLVKVRNQRRLEPLRRMDHVAG